ncbi:MAG TPA: molybdate ABC transporter permease subunit [Bacteroidales bacterium]|nr:MAG: Sulfate transport system permease protein CysT [Bacteroidetes bacterium ADurb.Bin217]HPM12707.1 molybdate ABC transporter permease subunit [Bacteroidales bacterium]
MDEEFIETMLITAQLSTVTTGILLCVGMPLAYWLAYSNVRFKPIVEALVSMPMVLPPSVLGYYILVAYSPNHWFGQWLLQHWDIQLAFTFEGIVIASVLFSLPFMVQPLCNGFRQVPQSIVEASFTLGKSKRVTFFKVLMPSIRPSIITAIALTFAHTIGEFGIVLMVGGNIPGETRVASIAIYDQVQALNFEAANTYATILFVIALVLLTLIYSLQKNKSSWNML